MAQEQGRFIGSEKLQKIFSREADRYSGEKLLMVLASPGGMETFVRFFGRRLNFTECTEDGAPGYLVSSSMGILGKFVPDEGGLLWSDEHGKETACITMVVSEKIGRALMDSYREERKKLEESLHETHRPRRNSPGDVF